MPRTGEIPRVQGVEWPREHSLFVDAEHNVWMGCNDTINGEHCAVLTKFTHDGKYLATIGVPGQPTDSKATNHFGRVAKISFDIPAQEAYVADGYANHRVAVLDMKTGAREVHPRDDGVHRRRAQQEAHPARPLDPSTPPQIERQPLVLCHGGGV